MNYNFNWKIRILYWKSTSKIDWKKLENTSWDILYGDNRSELHFAPCTFEGSAATASAKTRWLWKTTRCAGRPSTRRMSWRTVDFRRRYTDLTGFLATTPTTSTAAATLDICHAWRCLTFGQFLADSKTTTAATRRHDARCLGVRIGRAWFIWLRHESSATTTVTPPDANIASRHCVVNIVNKYLHKRFIETFAVCKVSICLNLCDFFL